MTRRSSYGSVAGNMAADINNLKWITIGVSVVAVAGFIALLITCTGLVLDSLADKKAINQSLVDKVNQQNADIQNLTNHVDQLSKALEAQQATQQAAQSD